MKTMLGLAICALACGTAWAEENAAALYKAKCANCHGAAGEGKASMKGTAIKGSGITADQVQTLLTKGAAGKKGPHGKAMSGLSTDQIKALADYVSAFR